MGCCGPGFACSYFGNAFEEIRRIGGSLCCSAVLFYGAVLELAFASSVRKCQSIEVLDWIQPTYIFSHDSLNFHKSSILSTIQNGSLTSVEQHQYRYFRRVPRFHSLTNNVG